MRNFSSSILTSVPSIVQTIDSVLSFILELISGIDVSDQMFPHIVTDMHLCQMTVIGQFAKEVFEEVVELSLELRFSQVAIWI